VDCEDHRAHAQQGRYGQVAAGLLDDAVAGVDKQNYNLGGGDAGDGVAGVLHVAWGISQDEGALVGGEVAVGNVDGDALLTLGAQAVDEEGQVEAFEATVGGGALYGSQLISKNRLGVVQEAA